ncbi:MAG TPA: hypothetical protein VMQ81_05695 [Acidimicrobiia bacterium]|nr:hypothetical protein [Acidimicrobiia bacterium]
MALTDGGFLFDGFTFLLAFAIVLPLGLLALVVLVLAGGRDIDTTGKRTFTLYVVTVSFVALFTALIASTAVVSSLTEKIKDDDSSEGFDFGDEDFEDFEDFDFDFDSDASENDRVLRGVVQGALVLLAAGAVLWFHHRRRREYTGERGFDGSAAWRADRAYLYVVCFTAILIFLFAAGFGSYNIFKLIGPGVFDSGDSSDIRKSALQELLTLAWLAVAALGIFRYYWLQAQPGPASSPAPPPTPATSGSARKAPARKAPAKKRS